MHEFIIKPAAQKQMERLPKDAYAAVKHRILDLRNEPRPRGAKKLVGGLGWRIRVGDYRVIYEVDDRGQVINIAAVKPRQSAYR